MPTRRISVGLCPDSRLRRIRSVLLFRRRLRMSPPPPRSVVAEASSRSRISMKARFSFSSSIGSAIWTAGRDISSDLSVSSAEAKVTPCMPSRPVLPPANSRYVVWFGFFLVLASAVRVLCSRSRRRRFRCSFRRSIWRRSRWGFPCCCRSCLCLP